MKFRTAQCETCLCEVSRAENLIAYRLRGPGYSRELVDLDGQQPGKDVFTVCRGCVEFLAAGLAFPATPGKSPDQLFRLAVGVSEAVIAYLEAIAGCADDPERMSSFCTAQGQDLDDLFGDMASKATAFLRAIGKDPFPNAEHEFQSDNGTGQGAHEDGDAAPRLA